MAIENSDPLSEEEIKQLPRNAQIALATRCAWRVMPATGAGGDFKFWGEKALLYVRALDALIAGLVLSTGLLRAEQTSPMGEKVQNSTARLEQAIQVARRLVIDAAAVVAIRSEASRNDDYSTAARAARAAEASFTYAAKVAAAAVCATAAFAAAAETSAAIVASVDSVNYAAGALENERPDATTANAINTATKVDFFWLIENQPKEQSWIFQNFFDRPLWPDGQPNFWHRIYNNWNFALRSTDPSLSTLYMQYELAMKGRVDWEDLSQFVQEWADTHVSKNGRQGEEKVSKEWPNTNVVTENTITSVKSLGPTYLIPGAATPGIDRPAEKDSLNRGSLVAALAQMFIAMENPRGMTIALLADWGAGKSTVFELLKQQLRKNYEQQQNLESRSRNDSSTPVMDFIFAEFNAWKYEQTSNIPAGLAQEVSQALIKCEGLAGRKCRSKTRLIFEYACREHGWKLLQLLAWVLCALLGGSVFIYLLTKSGEAVEKAIGITGTATFIIAFITLSFQRGKQLYDLLKARDFNTYLKLPSFDEHLGLIPLFRRHLKTLCRLTLSPKRRLVLIVDDLDRCQPEYISNVFDAIRLVMDLDNVIVLVGIDHRIAFKAMELRYEKLADGDRTKCEIARDYLGKIVHLPIRLLPLRTDELRHYIGDCLFANIAFEEPPPPVPEASAAEPDEIAPSAEENGQAAATAAQDSQNNGSNSPAPPKALRQSDTLDPLPAQTPLAVKFDTPVQASNGLSAEELRRAMQDLPIEHGWFTQLAQQYEFSNPRQLLRLRNSYRLLKAVALNDYPQEAERQAFEATVLQMLFWQEFLHTMPRAARHRCMAALADEANLNQLEPAKAQALNMTVDESERVQRVMKEVRPTMADVFKNKMRGEPPLESPARNYADLARWVRSVVLPHSEEGVLDTEAEIAAWITTL